MKFAQRVFLVAGIYGIVLLTPFYFLETKLGEMDPPAITHPEYFYGFVGVALAWQFVFLILARDPLRYRALMLPSILEKFSYVVAVVVLVAQGRLKGGPVLGAVGDLVLGILFVIAYLATREDATARTGE